MSQSQFTISLVPPILTLSPALPQRATGPFAGMSTVSLQAALGTAQAALLASANGTQPVTVSYGEGQGHRQVTYNRTNIAELRRVIFDLQCALGVTRRRAIGIRIP